MKNSDYNRTLLKCKIYGNSMVSNRRVLFLYRLKINRIEQIHRFKRGAYSVYLNGGCGKTFTNINEIYPTPE